MSQLTRLAIRYIVVFLSILLVPGTRAFPQLSGKPRLLLADGTSQFATLKSITSDGKWLFAAEKERLLGKEDFLAWGKLKDPTAGPFLLLRDNSILTGQPLSLTQDQFKIRSLLWGDVSLPRSAVRAVVWQWPARPQDRDELLAKLKEFAGRQEQALLASGDTLSGRVMSKSTETDFLLQISLEQNTLLDLPAKNLSAVLFRQPLVRQSPVRQSPVRQSPVRQSPVGQPASAETSVKLGFRNGDQLQVAETRIANGLVTSTLACGVAVSVDAVSYAEELSAIYPVASRTRHLSELKPIAYVHKPFFGSAIDYKLDSAVSGGRLRHRDGIFTHGIGMPSLSQVAFELDQDYKKFVAELALDDSAGQRGSVVYRLYVDKGTGKFQLAWQSKTIRGGEPAVLLSQDLTGVTRLSLVVSYADAADVLDRANWLGCWLVK